MPKQIPAILATDQDGIGKSKIETGITDKEAKPTESDCANSIRISAAQVRPLLEKPFHFLR